MVKRRLISICSTVLLVAHVSIGCCAHHEHNHDGTASIALASQHSHRHGHAAHHGEFDHSTPRHDHQPGDHHCGEGRCAFLATCKAGLPELVSPCAVAPISATAVRSQFGQQAPVENTRTGNVGPLPVRSHLIKQVLLV